MVDGKFGKKEQQHLIKFARIAWNRTLKEYYYPPLNDPHFVFDYTRKEGFYIDPEHRWQITMNLANIPLFTEQEEYINYFHAISLHEVSHYQIIPYDGLINAKLLKAAMKHVNGNFAPIVVNLFADLVIDTKLYKKFPELIYWELKQTYNYIQNNYKDHFSNFSKLLFRTYELLLNIQLSETNSNSTIDDLSEQIVKITLKDFEDETTWEQKVEKISSVLKTLILDTFTPKVGAEYDKNSRSKSPNQPRTGVEIPEDVLEIMDNPLEIKSSDKLKETSEDELRKKAEIFARETPYSEFGAPATQAGLVVDKNPLATWYRGLAKNLIEIKIYEEKFGGKMPIYPELWRIGEPIDQLDIIQTVLTSPVIIPNITTRKWSKEDGFGYLSDKQLPDLLLVIDSSGSMNWNYSAKDPRGQYHTALIASFAALHYAITKGIKFSIINFSNRPITCDWTKNYHNAEEVLLKYQGGGTHLPVESIERQCDTSERNSLVLIITDFAIYNWAAAKKTLIKLSENGHKIVGFFIGSSKIPQNRFKNLLDKVNFYPIKNEKKLINLVIEEVKKFYQ
ncbi:MAG: hypothetical protein ACFFBY_04330 [Promethearchaeota archaeon]